jgi:flagellar biosynthesis/type III secretory pathway protein FliH
VTTNALDYLRQKWRECYEQQQKLLRENTELRAQFAEAEHKRKIVVQNAYEDGFKAGHEETMKQRAKSS